MATRKYTAAAQAANPANDSTSPLTSRAGGAEALRRIAGDGCEHSKRIALRLESDDFLHLMNLVEAAETCLPNDTDSDRSRAVIASTKVFLVTHNIKTRDEEEARG